ncbi:MAG TPA: bifunctional demethylmenaquinone methyltransferase/2-methoxy-6-polyprenyl-1,4-benzoquinol methylase UbiE [Armatimonadota bacterium]|jgi:demethylmenaquinone methyltransferase/2-methoxy-6-polyprenyl-1,4-benzoquinol methylase
MTQPSAPVINIPQGDEKAAFVHKLFTQVAPTYDLLNRTLSVGQDRMWRRVAARLANLHPGESALDVATGTGDLAREMLRYVGTQGRVVGLDFCAAMLDLGRERNGDLRAPIEMVEGDAMALPFPDGAFNAAAIAFGTRNVVDLNRTFSEMARVVKPGGRVVCLELARPLWPPFRALYFTYFNRILPSAARMVHPEKRNYAYLPASLAAFVDRQELADIMIGAGLVDVRVVNLTGGIVAIHVGAVPEGPA